MTCARKQLLRNSLPWRFEGVVHEYACCDEARSEESDPRVQHVDPPDLKLWPTLRHLYPLWRAQWRLVLIGLTCALAFTGLSLAIPILVQRTIDNAIDGGDSALLLPYLGLILVIVAGAELFTGNNLIVMAWASD